MNKPYCSKRHGTPNGAAPSCQVPNCTICNQHRLNNFNQYCPNCYRCLKCQRVIKDKYNDGNLPEIPDTVLVDPQYSKCKERIKIPKFTHTKNVVRNYSFRPHYSYVKDYATDITLNNIDDITDLLNGNLDLLR